MDKIKGIMVVSVVLIIISVCVIFYEQDTPEKDIKNEPIYEPPIDIPHDNKTEEPEDNISEEPEPRFPILNKIINNIKERWERRIDFIKKILGIE